MTKSHFNDKTSFQKKVKVFSKDYLECCSYISNKSYKNQLSKRILYSKLAAASEILDDFLDFHHAINNNFWHIYAKICSMTKHFAIGAYWQKHVTRQQIITRISEQKRFKEKSEETISFFNETLVKITARAIKEAENLGIQTSSNSLNPENFQSVSTNDTLECNVRQTSIPPRKQDVAKIASDFLLLISDFNNLNFLPNTSTKQLVRLVPNKINTATVKRFEMLINNLRKSFSKCISEKNLESSYSGLTEVKNYLSMIFYLLRVTGSMLNLYEQHLLELNTNHNIHDRTKKEFLNLVNPNQLLHWAIGFGLNYICLLLSDGEKIAREILAQMIEISSIKVGVPVKFGFHTRPSLLVAKIVQHYGSKVYLEVGNSKFDAASALSIQWAGGKIQKEKICEVVFSGDTRALEDIKLLASINYGEDRMGKSIAMPISLNYLI